MSQLCKPEGYDRRSKEHWISESLRKPPACCPNTADVPIAFEVNSRFRVEVVSNGLGGLRLIEEKVDPPYVKDYDEPDGPERWSRRSWDLSRWIFLGAYREQNRIGGAIVAFHVDDMNYCEGREDLAGLWDIRVHPDYRGRGRRHVAVSTRRDLCEKSWLHSVEDRNPEHQRRRLPLLRAHGRQPWQSSSLRLPNRGSRRSGIDLVQGAVTERQVAIGYDVPRRAKTSTADLGANLGR